MTTPDAAVSCGSRAAVRANDAVALVSRVVATSAGHRSARGPSGVGPSVLVMRGSLYLTRTGLDSYTATREEYAERVGDLFGWMAEGKLRCPVFKTYGLDEAAEAHIAIESRGTTGKLLIAV